MEQQFKSLSIFEFQERFPEEGACDKYLADLKWFKQQFSFLNTKTYASSPRVKVFANFWRPHCQALAKNDKSICNKPAPGGSTGKIDLKGYGFVKNQGSNPVTFKKV